MKLLLTNAVEIAQRICKLKLNVGDVAVDCTMGNGHDTAFLGHLVGETGRIYAFDIQETALINTREKLAAEGLLERTRLILAGHQHLDHYVKENIKLAIFNLGYLPGGDHQITTNKDLIITAVHKCLSLLEAGGVVLLAIYPGHDSGREERIALQKFVAKLDQKEFNAGYVSFLNQVNNPPELICIEKR